MEKSTAILYWFCKKRCFVTIKIIFWFSVQIYLFSRLSVMRKFAHNFNFSFFNCAGLLAWMSNFLDMMHLSLYLCGFTTIKFFSFERQREGARAGVLPSTGLHLKYPQWAWSVKSEMQSKNQVDSLNSPLPVGLCLAGSWIQILQCRMWVF